MGVTSWRGQINRALRAIDHLGESKYQAKQEQDWQPGEAVTGLFSHGYRNTVFDRAVTFTNWLREQYPAIRLFRDVGPSGQGGSPCRESLRRTIMSVTIADVEYVAALAKLSFSAEEKVRLTGELNRILEYMDQLGTLDTAGRSSRSHR